MSTSGSGSSFLKWQIALGLGAMGAVGLAYWYLRSNKSAPLQTIEESNTIGELEETDFQRANRFKTEGKYFLSKSIIQLPIWTI